MTEPTASHLPRWRGFNLLEKYNPANLGPFRESDFDLIADWGFDFVRVPMSYRLWATPEAPREMNETILLDIDRAIELGRERGIHINLNIHRAPGYCVNAPAEPRDLWADPTALEDFAFTWAAFAKRYRGIPSRVLSFDLLNEPPDISAPLYAAVVRRVVEAIREQDPSRLIIVDGLKWGRDPIPELADLRIAQSTRGYEPMHISHYRARWVKSEGWPEPTWPMTITGDLEPGLWNRDRLVAAYQPWLALEAAGTGVHVGEFGCHHFTPHNVALQWLADLLSVWKANNWGWALWNLRGTFGVMDSNRTDVAYEPLGDHKLDRKMLELLRAW